MHVRLWLIALVGGLSHLGAALAANCQSVGSGNWSVAATWTSCNGATPQAADTVKISRGDTVTMNTTATISALSVGDNLGNGTSTLNFAAGSQLTVNGTVTLSGTNGNRAGVTDMSAGGTLIVNSATPFALGSGPVTWTPGAGTVQLGTTNTLLYSAGVFDTFNNLTIAANTTTLAGNTTITGNLLASGTLNTSTFTVDIAGNFTVNGVLSGSGAINLTGVGTTIAGTGSKTNTGTLTITNDKAVLAGTTLSLAGAFVLGSGTTTHSGTSLTMWGNVTINGTLAGTGAVNLTGAGATIAGTGSVTTSGTVTITGNKSIAAAAALTIGSPLSVSNATTVTNNGTITSTNTGIGITGAGTGLWINAANSTLNIAGPLTVPAFTASANPNTVNYNGAAAQTVRGVTYHNLTITKSASTGTLGGPTTVNNSLTVASGTLDVAANNLTVTGATSISGTLAHSSATGTKQYTGAVTINAGGSWTNAGNSAINFRGGLTHNGATFTAGTGIYTFDTNPQAIGGSSAIAIPNATVTGITLTNNNATTTGLTVSSALAGSGTLVQGTNAVLTLGGTSAITSLDASTNANTVVYSGAAAQTVKATTYRNLCVNNSSGLSLTADATVDNTLTFINGRLTTGANTLTVGSAGTIGSSTACIAGTLDGTRHLVGNLGKSFSAAGSFLYPVGDGTSYTPATVTLGASGFSAGSLTVSTANGAGMVTTPDHPNTTSGTDGLNKDKSVNRYWTVKRPAASGIAGSYTALFQYASGDLDGGTTASSLIFQQGSGCSGSGASRACSIWTQITTRSSDCSTGNPSSTLACATNGALPASATESDFALGELAGPSNFAREKQLIYTREQY